MWGGALIPWVPAYTWTSILSNIILLAWRITGHAGTLSTISGLWLTGQESTWSHGGWSYSNRKLWVWQQATCATPTGPWHDRECMLCSWPDNGQRHHQVFRTLGKDHVRSTLWWVVKNDELLTTRGAYTLHNIFSWKLMSQSFEKEKKGY